MKTKKGNEIRPKARVNLGELKFYSPAQLKRHDQLRKYTPYLAITSQGLMVVTYEPGDNWLEYATCESLDDSQFKPEVFLVCLVGYHGAIDELGDLAHAVAEGRAKYTGQLFT